MATAKKAKRTASKAPKAAKKCTSAAPKRAKPSTAAAVDGESVDATTVVAPAKARSEYESLLREMAAAERDELRGWDRKWEAVAAVLTKRYYLFDDEANTAPLWMKKHAHEEYRTGFRNARVASLASPDEEQKYTVTKIDLAYSIDEARQRAAAKAKGVEWSAPDRPKKLDLSKLQYTIERDAKRVSLGLDAVSVGELCALQASESRSEGAPRARISKSAKAVVRALNEHKTLRNVVVRERDNELTIDNVRANQLNDLGRVLVELDVTSDE
jgi:hypothetical protein